MAESITTAPPRLDLLERQRPRLSARAWPLHVALFLLTIVTTTLAGVALTPTEVVPIEPPLSSTVDYLLYIPLVFYQFLVTVVRDAVMHPHLLASGIAFSASLLAILFSHEMGHYLACRYYKVDATLPYFIPAPPMFLAGTFGAFIKIRSPIPSRRALFDIGLAGPLAGFVVALPLAIVGVLTVGPPQAPQDHVIFFNDPLLFRLIAKVAGVPLDPNAPINPYYMAAWIGLLVTSLNLMPVGQLDGGHGIFALFGRRAHKLIGRLAFVTVAVLAVLGFWLHSSPSGFLYAILIGIMLELPHPQPVALEPLGTKRIIIAIVTLLVFALCFLPFPISIT
jgi:membrane-associated protease RseP (regulator of RpoE activity)